MASSYRNPHRQIQQRHGQHSRRPHNAVEEILALCPESMGTSNTSTTTAYDAENRARTLKATAVAKIKELLTQMKEKIKVFWGLHCLSLLRC